MKRVENESFLKSFLLFFLSLALLLGLLFYFVYVNAKKNYEEKLFAQMKLCSFNLQCERFELDFVPKENRTLLTLHSGPAGPFAYFTVPGSEKYLMQLRLPGNLYAEELRAIQTALLGRFSLLLLAVGGLSALFSFYALHPLRQALRLTEEFVKDILHDFNTPLATLRLNAAMLKKEPGTQEKIARIEQSVETLLNLQQNLRGYLAEHAAQKEWIELSSLIKNRSDALRKLYPDITWELDIKTLQAHSNPDALSRILDNLLGNACKYNRPGGRVTITLDPGARELVIRDTGIGMAHPGRAFERFYTEHERGLGIGLHVVQKLCKMLDIRVMLTSRQGEGTTVSLDLSKLTLR